uniref:Cadherin domain-containing protein n=1 Tax=Magnetococcus massalia (strain MO-1) TaxID=451514 RepID=A0A1S7LE15_MAGMO|nr:protein of unknown function [Candidatus Magnetococcus massalia]
MSLQNDVATTSIGTPVVIDVLANDGGATTVEGTTTPSHGDATTTLADDKIVYTPDADFVGTDSFMYLVFDSSGNPQTALVTVNVSASNSAVVNTSETTSDFSTSPQTEGRITPGYSVTGTISSWTDEDWFGTYLQADTAYRIDLEGADTQKGTIINPEIASIRNSAGSIIASNPNVNGGVGLNDQMDFTPDTDGFYFIAASGTSSGTYTLSVDSYEHLQSLNSPPTDITLSNSSIQEHLMGATVGTLAAVDSDSGDTHTFTLKSDPSGLFEISGNTLKLKENFSADYEVSSQPAIMVQVSDSAQAITEKVITITITDDQDSTPDDVVLTQMVTPENTEHFYSFGTSVDLTADRAIVGSLMSSYYSNSLSQPDSSTTSIYTLSADGGVWNKVAQLAPPSGDAVHTFGAAVAIKDNIALVSDTGTDPGVAVTDTGVVYAYNSLDNGQTWNYTSTIQSVNSINGEEFGTSITLYDNNLAIIGANTGGDLDGNNDTGVVYLFRTSDTGETWSEVAQLLPTDLGNYDGFGYAVASTDNRIIVGAPRADSEGTGKYSTGAAYIFQSTDNGVTWDQEVKIVASDPQHYGLFGTSVAISGDYLVVGSPYSDDHGPSGASTGAAYVFKTTDGGTTWNQTAKILSSDNDYGDGFGREVAIYGDTLVVGAPWKDSADGHPVGASYVFKTSDLGESWQQIAKLESSILDYNNHFGGGVAIADGALLIGDSSSGEHASLPNGIGGSSWTSYDTRTGAAYFYEIENSDPSSDPSPSIPTYDVPEINHDYSADKTSMGAVLVSSSVTGTVGESGDQDWFATGLTAGTTYRIDLEGADTNKGTLSNPTFFGVYDSTGSSISGTEDWNGGVGKNAQVDYTPSTSGLYYLSAGSHLTGSYTLSIDTLANIQANNSAPTDIALSSYTITENESGATVGTLSATDSDSGDTATFSLLYDSSNLFEVVGSTLKLKSGSSADNESASSHALTLQVTDSVGNSFNETLTIYVADVLEPGQTNTSESSSDFSENSSTQGSILSGYSVTGSVGQSGDRDWFAVQLTAGTQYRIDLAGADSGQGTLANPTLYGIYNSASSYQSGSWDGNSGLGFNAQESFTPSSSGIYYLAAGGSELGSYTLSIDTMANIQANNSAPTDIALSSYSVTENESGATVGTLTATDSDTGDTATFSLLYDSSNLFEVVGSTLKLKSGSSADNETASSHTLTLQVTDSVGSSFNESVTISVDDVAEAGQTNNSESSTDFSENSSTQGSILVGYAVTGSVGQSGDRDWFAVQLTAGTQYRVDIEGADSSQGTLANPTLYGIYNSASSYQSGSWDGNSGLGLNAQESFTPSSSGIYYLAAGGSGLGSYTLSVDTMANIQANNSSPTNITLSSSSVNENSAGATVGTLSANDSDSGDYHLFSIVSDSSNLFEVSGSTLSLQAGSSTDYETATSHSITVRATDSAGATYDKQLTITVNDINETSGGTTGPVEIGKLTASDGQTEDYLGYASAISGSAAIVGAYKEDTVATSAGAAYIYQLSNGSWGQTAKIQASDAGYGDYFGQAVAISGDYALIGAPYADDGATNSGEAYLFQKSANSDSWSEISTLQSSTLSSYDYFGYTVEIEDETAMVGAIYGDTGGAVSVFNKGSDGVSWVETAQLTAADIQYGDYFSIDMAISGNYAIIGASRGDDLGTDSGVAYIFESTDGGSSWAQKTKLLASDGASYDYFGTSVSISGNYAIVGAHYDDDQATSTGSAYIFTSTDGWDSWSQVAKLTASDAEAHDLFGANVEIVGNYALISAHGEDGSSDNQGAAYLFERSADGTTWQEVTKLQASDGSSFNDFGKSLGMDEEHFIIGAYGHDSQADDDGAAYIYSMPTTTSEPGQTDNSESSSDFTADTSTLGSILLGSSVTGTIDQAGDRDWFAVQLTAGESCRIDLEGVDTDKGTLANPTFYGVYTSSGSMITGSADWNSGTERNALEYFTPDSSGIYYLSAGSHLTGSYTLTISESAGDDYSATTSGAGTITVGSSATGVIEESNDHDWFAVTLTAGTTYQIDLEGADTSKGSLVNPTFYGVYTSAGSMVTGSADWNGGVGLNAQEIFTATSSGTHYLSAGSHLTGTYTLSISETVADDYSAAASGSGSVSVGGSVTGEIEQGYDEDWFAVTLSAGTTYRIDLEGSDTSKGTLVNPTLHGIYDSNGSYIATSADWNSGFGMNAQELYTPSSSGTYYLSSGSHLTGTYTLSVDTLANIQANNSAPTNITLSSSSVTENEEGATVGTLSATDSDSGDTATFSILTDSSGLFEIEGTTLKLQSGSSADYESSSSYSLQLQVVDSAGESYSESLTITVTDVDEGSSGGGVSVSEGSTDLPASTATSGVVAVNGSATGTIGSAYEHDWFAVQLESGVTYQIDLEGYATSKGTLFDPLLQALYTSSGSAISGTYNDDGGYSGNSQLSYTADSSDTYYIGARAYGSYTGSYTLSVTDFSSQGTLTALTSTSAGSDFIGS